MRRLAFLALFMLGMFGASPALAQNAEIEATIGAQLDAFRADDVARAFSYASPTIQELFGTPQNFGRMVRGGYPMVWRPGAVAYLDLIDRGRARLQRVQITDADGIVHLLEYQMVPLADDWKINGVRILQSARPAV